MTLLLSVFAVIAGTPANVGLLVPAFVLLVALTVDIWHGWEPRR